MLKQSVVIFTIYFGGVVIIYQLNPVWGVCAFILWMAMLFVHMVNLSVGQPLPITPEERETQSFPVRVEVNGMPLSVLLRVTVTGPNAKGTLACFNTEDYWRSVIHPAMVGCDTKDALRIELAIRRAAQQRAEWFNSRMGELASKSCLLVETKGLSLRMNELFVLPPDYLAPQGSESSA